MDGLGVVNVYSILGLIVVDAVASATVIIAVDLVSLVVLDSFISRIHKRT